MIKVCKVMWESFCKEFILFHQSVFNNKHVIFSQSNALKNQVFSPFEKTRTKKKCEVQAKDCSSEWQKILRPLRWK